jgi:hypothetical protein
MSGPDVLPHQRRGGDGETLAGHERQSQNLGGDLVYRQ